MEHLLPAIICTSLPGCRIGLRLVLLWGLACLAGSDSRDKHYPRGYVSLESLHVHSLIPDLPRHVTRRSEACQKIVVLDLAGNLVLPAHPAF